MTDKEHPTSVDVDVEQATAEKAVLNQHVDKAAKFLIEGEHYPPLSPEAERKLIRKVDWIMIPMVRLSPEQYVCELNTHCSSQLFITATLGAVDKVALGTAAIYGLRTDTHLVGQQYSWLGSILSLGVGLLISMCKATKLISHRPWQECFPPRILSIGFPLPNTFAHAVWAGQPWRSSWPRPRTGAH